MDEMLEHRICQLAASSSCPLSEHGRNYRRSQISERFARVGV